MPAKRKAQRATVGGQNGGKAYEMDEENNPSTPSLSYQVMKPRWEKMNALLGGTEAMRLAGQTYLPQHEAEKDDRYQKRLQATTLLNMTKLTLETWTGKPFADPIKLNDDVPKKLQEYCEDVDLLGNNLTVFGREWFREGLAKSFSHVLVEMPRKTLPESGVRTLADDLRENMRPYLVHVQPENLVFAHAIVVAGREILQEVRILEQHMEVVGFNQKVVTRIRQIFPGRVVMWKLVEKTRETDKEEWILEEEFTYDLPFIPLVTFYAQREGFQCGISPLDGLADLNICHWQSSSDQRNILTVCRFPMLALSGGLDDDKKLEVGPNKWLFTPDPQGKFYYVEHTGQAIEAGRQDLIDLEEQMSNFGAQFLKKRPSHTTATSRMMDTIESTSPLQDSVLRFKDAVEQVLGVMAIWEKLGKDQGGTIEINTDFDKGEYDETDIKALLEARKNRDISRRVFLSELRRRDLVSDRFDADKNDKELEAELSDLLAVSVDLDPGGGGDPGKKVANKKPNGQ